MKPRQTLSTWDIILGIWEATSMARSSCTAPAGGTARGGGFTIIPIITPGAFICAGILGTVGPADSDSAQAPFIFMSESEGLGTAGGDLHGPILILIEEAREPLTALDTGTVTGMVINAQGSVPGQLPTAHRTISTTAAETLPAMSHGQGQEM